MQEYAFTRECASTFNEFADKFPKIKPHAVVLDYDLLDGFYHEEVATIVKQARDDESRHIGLIGVTAQDPFDKIKKMFKSVDYDKVLYNNGTNDFYLDLIAEFHKIHEKVRE